MARYIDADLLIKKIFPLGMIDDGNFPVNAKAVKVTIDKLPTADVVEVVRCENCIHRTEDDFCFKVASDVVPKKVKGDFYCGYGKKEGD